MVQKRAFWERLQDAVNRYHTNAITTAQVLEELIVLAKDIRAARQRGEEEGLSDDEIAFYDALAENESAVEVMGDDQLKVIAHELLTRTCRQYHEDLLKISQHEFTYHAPAQQQLAQAWPAQAPDHLTATI